MLKNILLHLCFILFSANKSDALFKQRIHFDESEVRLMAFKTSIYNATPLATCPSGH